MEIPVEDSELNLGKSWVKLVTWGHPYDAWWLMVGNQAGKSDNWVRILYPPFHNFPAIYVHLSQFIMHGSFYLGGKHLRFMVIGSLTVDPQIWSWVATSQGRSLITINYRYCIKHGLFWCEEIQSIGLKICLLICGGGGLWTIFLR